MHPHSAHRLRAAAGKLRAVQALCARLGVHTAPACVGGVWVVPLFSWYSAHWDREPDVPGSTPISKVGRALALTRALGVGSCQPARQSAPPFPNGPLHALACPPSFWVLVVLATPLPMQAALVAFCPRACTNSPRLVTPRTAKSAHSQLASPACTLRIPRTLLFLLLTASLPPLPAPCPSLSPFSLLQVMLDFHVCAWPAHLGSADDSLARHFDALNEPAFTETLQACGREDCPGCPGSEGAART